MFGIRRKQVGMLALAALLVSGSFLSWAWQWAQSIWADNGACIDPNGRPCASATVDEGMHIDPNG